MSIRQDRDEVAKAVELARAELERVCASRTPDGVLRLEVLLVGALVSARDAITSLVEEVAELRAEVAALKGKRNE